MPYLAALRTGLDDADAAMVRELQGRARLRWLPLLAHARGGQDEVPDGQHRLRVFALWAWVPCLSWPVRPPSLAPLPISSIIFPLSPPFLRSTSALAPILRPPSPDLC